MTVVGIDVLRRFAAHHVRAEKPVRWWINIALTAAWSAPEDVMANFPRASALPGNRILFRLAGNHFRLVATIDYTRGIVVIDRIGTHADYDRWRL